MGIEKKRRIFNSMTMTYWHIGIWAYGHMTPTLHSIFLYLSLRTSTSNNVLARSRVNLKRVNSVPSTQYPLERRSTPSGICSAQYAILSPPLIRIKPRPERPPQMGWKWAAQPTKQHCTVTPCLRLHTAHFSLVLGMQRARTSSPCHMRGVCIICIGVVSAVSQYNCVYYCDTCYIQDIAD
jgi:hypothetical protein